ncbi:MAG: hypothetical protein ACQEW8_10830 [Actinomycetota bacterium]
MTQTDIDRRSDYLARLDSAMAAVPHGIAIEIRTGIAEELAALDGAELAARLDQLGDPRDIAREAQAEGADAPPAVRPPVAGVRTVDSRGFATTAALALGFGGILLPGVGWAVGAVMVCLSTLWRAREKVIAIAVPFATVAIAMIIAWSVWAFSTGGPSGSGAGSEQGMGNPLVPGWYDFGWHGIILLGLLVVPASGLWLLWRMRERGKG